LSILGFIFTSNLIYSQECKYAKNEIDKFTKEKKLLTEAVIVAEDIEIKKVIKISKVEFQAKMENDQRILRISLYLKSGAMAMSGSEKLICLMSNDEVVKLNLAFNLPSISSKGSHVIYTYDYIVNDTNFEKLIRMDIKDVRVEATVNSVDFSIIKAVSTMNIFKCIK
jgi:hypothetical protein